MVILEVKVQQFMTKIYEDSKKVHSKKCSFFIDFQNQLFLRVLKIFANLLCKWKLRVYLLFYKTEKLNRRRRRRRKKKEVALVKNGVKSVWKSFWDHMMKLTVVKNEKLKVLTCVRTHPEEFVVPKIWFSSFFENKRSRMEFRTIWKN